MQRDATPSLGYIVRRALSSIQRSSVPRLPKKLQRTASVKSCPVQWKMGPFLIICYKRCRASFTASSVHSSFSSATTSRCSSSSTALPHSQLTGRPVRKVYVLQIVLCFANWVNKQVRQGLHAERWSCQRRRLMRRARNPAHNK